MSALGELRHGPLRILIVEDDPDHRYLLVRGLRENYGDEAELIAAETIEAAEHSILHDDPACIVLDLSLGHVGGTTALERVRPLTQAPILVLTGRADLNVRALELGADEYLQKGQLDPNGVATVINAILARADAARERASLAAIVESAQMAMYVRSPSGTILTWNPAAESIYGYRHHEIVGSDVSLLVPESRWEQEEAIASAVMAGQPMPRYETQHRRKDGSLVALGVTVSAIEGPGGGISALSVIARDVTAELHMGRERDLLSGIVDSSLSAIVSIDLEGRITSWNRGAEVLFGYTPGEMIGRTPEVLIPESRRDEFISVMESARGRQELEQIESVRLAKDGRAVDVVINWSAIRSVTGERIGLAAIYHDITSRKAAERELAHRTVQLAEAQRIAALGSWELEVATGVVSWSDEMFRLFGFEAGEFDPRLDDVLALTNDEDRPRVVATLEKVINDRTQAETEMTITRRDGSQAVLHVRGQAAVDDDGSVRVLGTAQDITERKKLEDQLVQSQKMEALGGLAGGIAHDFNNLLAVILNYGRFVADDLPEGHRSRNDMEAILEAAQRGSGLVKQLLAFSRKEVVRPDVINLNYTVSQMEPLIRRLTTESIALETVLDEHLWDTMADRGQLEQVLLNLVVNARDAMPSGGRIIISTRNVEADDAFAASHPEYKTGRYACIIVSDTGQGMSRETQARIFEPFFTTKPLGEGTGLGLATIYGIVKRVGGFISVYSELGLGTTFKLYFPATTLTDPEIEAPDIRPSERGRGERVLVVEDEESVLSLITRMLTEGGYDVLPISSPEEALPILNQDDSVAVLLTDVIMPQMSGRSLSEAARVPTIFMSGYTDSIIEHQGVLDRGVLFLPKPFTSEELLGIVRNTIDDRARSKAFAQE